MATLREKIISGCIFKVFSYFCISLISISLCVYHTSTTQKAEHFTILFILFYKHIHRLITIDYINARGLFHGAETFVSVSSLHGHFSPGGEGGGAGGRTPTSNHSLLPSPVFFIFHTPSEDKKRTCKHAIETCVMIYFKVYTGSTILILWHKMYSTVRI